MCGRSLGAWCTSSAHVVFAAPWFRRERLCHSRRDENFGCNRKGLRTRVCLQRGSCYDALAGSTREFVAVSLKKKKTNPASFLYRLLRCLAPLRAFYRSSWRVMVERTGNQQKKVASGNAAQFYPRTPQGDGSLHPHTSASIDTIASSRTHFMSRFEDR